MALRVKDLYCAGIISPKKGGGSCPGILQHLATKQIGIVVFCPTCRKRKTVEGFASYQQLVEKRGK